MSINVTITAESAQQLAEQLVTMAFLVAPNLREKLGTSTAAPVSVETETKAPKPRGRKPAQTIEHDEKENADVRTAGVTDTVDSGSGDVDGAATADAGGDVDPAGEAGREGGETGSEATNDTPAEVDDVAKSEPPSYDDVRAHVINDYLNKFYRTQEERAAAFRALLEEFKAESMKTLPAEKLAEVNARVDALIAEKAIA